MQKRDRVSALQVSCLATPYPSARPQVTPDARPKGGSVFLTRVGDAAAEDQARAPILQSWRT